MTHVIGQLDDVVHQRVRLGLLAVLDEAGEVDFNFLRETLDLTAGNLSRHLGVLEDAGLVVLDKVLEGRRPRTWVKITQEGAAALRDEIAILRELLPFDGSSSATASD